MLYHKSFFFNYTLLTTGWQFNKFSESCSEEDRQENSSEHVVCSKDELTLKWSKPMCYRNPS